MKNKSQKGSTDYVVDVRTPVAWGPNHQLGPKPPILMGQAEILQRRSKAAIAENMPAPFVDTFGREVEIRLVLK